MGIRRLTHLGICVSDLDRSLAFYGEVLGCREIGRFRDDDGYSAKLVEIDEVQLEAVYLERDGWRIELLSYPTPGTTGSSERRPMNQLGLTHLSFVVDDLDAVLGAVRRHGGSVVEATRMEARATAIFVTDPDGTRIELIERDGDPMVVPGSE